MRPTMPREFYIPKNSTKIADKQSDAVAYVYERGGKPLAAIFYGNRAKPIAHYSYRNEERRAQAIADAFNSRRAALAHKIKQQAERKAWANPYKVGDLFRRSWGYDQTNIDWYEVVDVRGKMLMVREIQQERVSTGWMQGKTTPQPGKFREGAPRKCLAQDGRIKINHYAHAYYVKPEIVGGVPVYGVDHYSEYA